MEEMNATISSAPIATSATKTEWTSSRFIGQVAASYLRERLEGEENDGSTSRFIIDQLTAEQTAAIARAILDDPELSERIEIKLPHHFVEDFVDEFELPPDVLTEQRATSFRNAHIGKPALLLACTGDDETQSLKFLDAVGASQLLSVPHLWVEWAARDLPLPSDASGHWEKALAGLRDLNGRSLDRIAEYVLQTRRAIEDEGQPLLHALGVAMPALLMPRDTKYFTSLSAKTRGWASAWRKLYENADRQRSPYLRKQTPNQLLLNASDLRSAFSKVKSGMPDELHPRVEAFIQSPSGWNDAAGDLAECEWDGVKPLFDGLKREKLNLGKMTAAFYEERDADLLTDDEREYLGRLSVKLPPELSDDERDFYENHRNQLKEDRKLKSAWDKYIYGSPLATNDFLTGFALCLERLVREEPSTNRRLRIRLDGKSSRDLKELNVEAGLFFATRYKGLKSLFGKGVRWDVGELWDFPEALEKWRQGPKYSPTRSTKKSALQLKFTLELEVDFPAGGSDTYRTQLIWQYDPNSVTSQFASDWQRLQRQPLVFCEAAREPVSTKGRFQAVDLHDVRTLMAAFDKDRGSFVSVYKPKNNIATQWTANFKQAKQDQLISADVERDLRDKWDDFQGAYSAAIKGFWEEGLACDGLLEATESYAALLEAICRQARGDRNRELLLRPLLRIGSVSITGGPPAEVIAPWHPLRLAALAVKAYRVSALLKHFLSEPEVRFGDTGRLFFRDLQAEMEHSFYPEVALGWHESKAELLALADTAGDYTLHEMPRIGEGDETGENPTEASKRVAALVERYLALHPHESANLSVVLYNCDSARLPHAVVDRISLLHEGDENVRCQVMLRHRDGRKLRTLYERIIESSGNDSDTSTSETTRDFMARLRIGISADQAPPPNPKEGPPNDIVFSQDVIARHAQVDWFPESARPVPLGRLNPSAWSRRRPAARDDRKSRVYLCCPAQSHEGWAYLTAMCSFLEGDWDGVEETRLLPARQLDFNDLNMRRIFDETHNLGNWIVNYDELLDRRQLLNQDVRVIRYKQSATQGRNLIISSTAPTGLLDSMLMSRLRDLELDLPEDELRELAGRFKREAGEISGDIVLRAAKRGRSASELMGIVLSRFLIRHEVEAALPGAHFGWYFLDDYADWLGQREEQIADILMLSPSKDGDNLSLAVVVSEAKYIDYGGLNAGAKNSRSQLRDTVRRVNDALFGAPERLDRSLWLSRLSDLLLDGVQFPASADINLADWRRAVRDGECGIWVRGYSHVFVSGPASSPDCSDMSLVADMTDGYQEVFSRARVRELVLKYLSGESPMPLRHSNATLHGDASVWDAPVYRKPTNLLEVVLPRSPSRAKPTPSAIEVTPSAIEVTPDAATSANSSNGKAATPEVTPTIGVSEPMLMVTNGALITQDTAVPIPGEVQVLEASGEEVLAEGDEAASTMPSRWAYKGIEPIIAGGQKAPEGNAEDAEWLKSVEGRTKMALQGFGLQAKLQSSQLTPNAALLKFQGSANLTVDQVMRRQTEFKTTYGLSLVSAQPEPSQVALALERPRREVVRLEDIWGRWQRTEESEELEECGNQEIPIATRENDGSILFLSPQRHAPHTLIAGSTGSGKSVLMQNIILSIAATNTPAQAQMLLIDPKLGVDYFAFESLPHLQGGIIDSQEVALAKLNELAAEMDARYRRFREAKTPNFMAYNRKVSESDRLPAIWLIHDEFAEWMLVEEYKQQVTALVGRLGVKARAAGIYLVFAAQRPDNIVMPLQLRANLGNRLILRVDSEGTSEIALAEKGAERLLGKGHLLARLEGEPSLVYAQVPLISESVMERLVEVIST